MGKASELAESPLAGQAAIESLQKLWSKIYQELAKEDVSGEEVLRIAATLYYGPGHGKPRPAEESLDLLNKEAKNSQIPLQISQRLLAVAEKLTELYSKPQLNAVTDVLQSRLLAVALLLAKGVTDAERTKLLDQWERTTFRTFVLFGKDSRAKVGDYVKLAFKIVKEDIETRTYNQIMAGLRSLGEEFGIDRALEEGLKNKDFYEMSPEGCRYLLWNYEESLARSTGRHATVDENVRAAIWNARASDSIEHIFPQSPSSAWKGKWGGPRRGRPVTPNPGRIGNLILLPGGLNSSAKAESFKHKKTLYIQHHLRMVDEITSEQDWTLNKIEAREARLIEWAKSRWADI